MLVIVDLFVGRDEREVISMGWRVDDGKWGKD